MTQTNAPRQSSQAITHKSALLGVDLGSNHIRVGTVDPAGQVLAFRREPYSEEARKKPRALADQILSVSWQMAEDQAATAPVSAVGVAFPGLVNQATHRAVELAQLPSLAEIDLRREIMQAFGVPTHFENNANAAAFAEMTMGATRDAGDWLYLHIGANVSAGLVLNGRLHRGKSGLAGAIGNMNVYTDHPGGLMPLQAMASAESVVRRTRERLQKDRTSSLSKLGAMGGFTYDDIITQAHAGDDLAKMMLNRTGAYIAMAIADVINLLNLAMVAIGGAPAARQFLTASIADGVRERAFTAAISDCQVVAAELEVEASVIGAALLAADEIADCGRA
ncbi:MAG TPA: ROK family protein [Blastocatellia bacterium]|nr:ROK family protein [Blastocatellia bacterium]